MNREEYLIDYMLEQKAERERQERRNNIIMWIILFILWLGIVILLFRWTVETKKEKCDWTFFMNTRWWICINDLILNK